MSPLVRAFLSVLIGLAVTWMASWFLPHSVAVVLGLLAGIWYFMDGSRRL